MSPGRELPSRPRPLSRCSARRPRPELRGGARPVPLSLAAPGAQCRAPATGRACRVGQAPDLTFLSGWPAARGPGCCHSRGFRLGPEARAPRPERSASRGDVRAPPAAARLQARAANCSSWDEGGGCGDVWLACPSRWRPPGSGRCTSPRPFPVSRSRLSSPHRSSPRRAPQRRGGPPRPRRASAQPR